MKQQGEIILKLQWRKGKQFFEGGRQKFAAIPKQERSSYNKKMIETKQDINPPPIIFHKQYPSYGKFQYQGYSLHYAYIENTINPKAILVHFHGLNGHGGSSGYFSSVIAEKNKNLNIYVMDQLNFGQSEGPFRGEIRSFQDSVKQGDQFINFIVDKFKQKPKIFLSGSSFGGTIIFKMIINKPQTYAGALLITPALRNLAEHQPYLKKVAKFLGWIMPKTLFIPQTLGGSTKYKSQQIIKNDPYFYKGKVVLGSIRILLNSVDEISVLYNLFNIPYITFQAGVDKSVDSFAGLDLEQLSPSKDKTTIYCQNMWHSAFLEEEIQGIAWKCAQWLKERI